MFAIGLYDRRLKRLILVRDRFGVKPLYFIERANEVAFASTPSVLAEHFGCPTNLRYVQQGIDYRVYEDDTEQSPYLGLSSLPAGMLAIVTLDGGQVRVERRRYYDLYQRVPAKIQELAGMSEGHLIETLLATLGSASTLRMRADVPVALSVSGGLDSTSIASVLSEKDYDLRGTALEMQMTCPPKDLSFRKCPGARTSLSLT